MSELQTEEKHMCRLTELNSTTDAEQGCEARRWACMARCWAWPRWLGGHAQCVLLALYGRPGRDGCTATAARHAKNRNRTTTTTAYACTGRTGEAGEGAHGGDVAVVVQHRGERDGEAEETDDRGDEGHGSVRGEVRSGHAGLDSLCSGLRSLKGMTPASTTIMIGHRC